MNLSETKLPVIDAQESRALYPDTFYAPTLEEVGRIEVGMTVKIGVALERFWVTVTEVDHEQGRFKGTVDNYLINTDEHGLDYGDEVEFGARHVMNIWELEDIE